MIRDIKSAKVAAVFVTMNRSSIALTCLQKLAVQTRKPDHVYVIDNASTDDTAEVLSCDSVSHSTWRSFQRLSENLGNAGGMEIAVAKAFADGHDFVWILDDDSWPELDALELLLAADLPSNAVRTSRVVDISTGNLSWPLQIHTQKGWQFREASDPLPEEATIRIRRSWLGVLISREVYERIGPIEGRLFLRGEDEDYPRRIERAGFPVFMVRASLVHHPPAGLLHRWSFFGREIVLEQGLTGDKLYYRLRNSWWLAGRDFGAARPWIDASLCFIALVRWEGLRSSWLPIWWEAFRDAMANRLGRRKVGKPL
jgi:rhamnopyranosyl-N-acetylglucosaminyl-diphospho-decaprenol beta-1,3/1,4-galactofuranosyltransferase